MSLPSIKNRVGMSVSGTPGTGTITLASAESGYQSFSTAYGANANVDILIQDGTAWEVARDCTYTHSGTTVTRGTLEASSTGSALSLTSSAKVYVVASAARLTEYEKMVDSGFVSVTNTDGVAQTFTVNADTKVTTALGTELSDPNGWWDHVNKKFQPTRAGKYLILFHCQMSSGTTVAQAMIYKNGSSFQGGPVVKAPSDSTGWISGELAAVVSMNGSTDYLELYMYTAPSGGTTTASTPAGRVTFTALYWGP